MDNIETKVLRPKNHFYEGGEFDELEDLKAFGWEIQSQQEYTYRSGRCHRTGTEYVLVRDLNQPNLNEKRNYEALYEQEKESLCMPPEGPDFGIAIGLLLLFIIPGVIYLVVTSNNRKNGIEVNQKTVGIMRDYVENARNL